MTRVVDKRNVCILAKGNEAGKTTVYFMKRGEDIDAKLFDGLYDDKFEINGDTITTNAHLTTPDMLLIVDPFKNPESANVKAFFNGVEVPAIEIKSAGEPYKVWGLKSQDLVFLDLSSATT